jgi:predicted nucleic acid-binding protein
MATNRIGFKKIVKDTRENEKINIVIDSNILIAYFDEVHSDHDEAVTFLNELDNKADAMFYTTVTTKSKFLDYHRKRFLTEGLIALVRELSDLIKISTKSKVKIQNILNLRDNRLRKEEKKFQETQEFNSYVNYFTDNEIKDIKRSFRARDIEDEAGWLQICMVFIGKKLSGLEKRLDEFCEYLTTRDKKQKENIFIVKEVDWKRATSISSETGMAYSDSMILNMALATNIQNIATLDFDVVYAGAVSASNKKVLLPDNRIASFKQILKKLPKQ